MPYKDKEKKRARDKKYYLSHREEIKEKQRKKDLKRHKEIREWITEYRSTLKCERCPENDPCCLDFHHRDPSKKEITIARAIQIRWSKTRIQKEIVKCIALCANCHRKLHASLTQSG